MTFPIDTDALWSNVSNREAKEAIAKELVGRAIPGDVIGFGSGTTSMVCAVEFGKAVSDGLDIHAVVTSLELEWLCAKLSIPVTGLHVAPINWCFDGADEIDKNGNALKGRGGAMHREREVFRTAQKRILVADASKDVNALGEKFPAPVEIEPLHAVSAMEALSGMGFDSVTIRTGDGKDGPVVTEQGNFIADVVYRAGFSEAIATDITDIEGVFDTGLFMGFDFERIS